MSGRLNDESCLVCSFTSLVNSFLRYNSLFTSADFNFTPTGYLHSKDKSTHHRTASNLIKFISLQTIRNSNAILSHAFDAK
jgi:hypothetical protein